MMKELKLYFHTVLFAAIIYGLFFLYLQYSPASIPRNNAVANTAVFLMGFSMLLTSLCYFWNLFDRFSIYKKYLGLVGFAFAVTHILLYIPAFMSLFSAATWHRPFIWALLTGLASLLIFTVMALISNTFMAKKLGGRTWKMILRTGYIALLLAGIHIVLISKKGWIAWYQNGFDTWPALNLFISAYIVVVLIMRIALWIALKNRKPTVPTAANPGPTEIPATATPAATPTPATTPAQAPVEPVTSQPLK